MSIFLFANSSNLNVGSSRKYNTAEEVGGGQPREPVLSTKDLNFALRPSSTIQELKMQLCNEQTPVLEKHREQIGMGQVRGGKPAGRRGNLIPPLIPFLLLLPLLRSSS